MSRYCLMSVASPEAVRTTACTGYGAMACNCARMLRGSFGPGTAVGWVSQYPRREAGLLDHLVLVEQRAHPAQVERVGGRALASGHDPRVGSEVGDGVEHPARSPRVAVELLDARVDNLEGRSDVGRRREHIGERHRRAAQCLVQ